MLVLICGNYGRGLSDVDGQTIKTRTLKDAVAESVGVGAVGMLDTASVFRHPLAFYRTAHRHFNTCTHLVMLPGRRGLRVLLPLFLRWRRTHQVDFRYVVVGGWLPGLLGRSLRLRRQCMQLDGIYVETASMAASLTAMGLRNVAVLPNFRAFDRNRPISGPSPGPPIRLVFCARVIREKGIEDAIAAVDRLNADFGRPVASLDVYGPVPDAYRGRFDRLVARSHNTKYNGVVPVSQVYDVLQHYDLVLFPTYYAGEGFPGTVIDAFVAGVPVLASDWKYNREIIEEGRTGAICPPRSPERLADVLAEYVRAPRLLTGMRRHCLERAQQFHVDHALQPFLRHLATGDGPAGPLLGPRLEGAAVSGRIADSSSRA